MRTEEEIKKAIKALKEDIEITINAIKEIAKNKELELNDKINLIRFLHDDIMNQEIKIKTLNYVLGKIPLGSSNKKEKE